MSAALPACPRCGREGADLLDPAYTPAGLIGAYDARWMRAWESEHAFACARCEPSRRRIRLGLPLLAGGAVATLALSWAMGAPVPMEQRPVALPPPVAVQSEEPPARFLASARELPEVAAYAARDPLIMEGESPPPMLPVGSGALAPVGFPPHWIGPQDYPVEAIRAKQEGKVVFALTIAPNGRPSRCLIAKGSGHAALDSATCERLMDRAIFYPQRDAQGRGVEAEWIGSIEWLLYPSDIGRRTAVPAAMAPRGAMPSAPGIPAPAAPGIGPTAIGDPNGWLSAQPEVALVRRAGGTLEIGFRIDVDSAGRPTGCRVTKGSGDAGFDGRICPEVLRKARFRPALRGTSPVEGHASYSFSWSVQSRPVPRGDVPPIAPPPIDPVAEPPPSG